MRTDGHQVVLTFTLYGPVASIEERLKVLVGFAHDLAGRDVRATIDPDADYNTERLDQAILNLNFIRDEYARVRALKTALCDDTETATPKQCFQCPNRTQMPDGGTMCDLTQHAIKGAL